MPVTPLRSPELKLDIDGAMQRLGAIEALATLLSISRSGDEIEHVNAQTVAAAWDGVALLAADATRHLDGTA